MRVKRLTSGESTAANSTARNARSTISRMKYRRYAPSTSSAARMRIFVPASTMVSTFINSLV